MHTCNNIIIPDRVPGHLLVLLVLGNSPKEVRVVLHVLLGYGAFRTVADHYGTEVLGDTSYWGHCV